MSTATAAMSRLQPDRPVKRKKEQRSDIWSSLLRQTREAQARSRTQAVQHRSLLLCGGSPDDQQSLVQGISRPPPAQPPTRSHQDRKPQRVKGEVRLSNKYAYGYGYITLYSPPQQSGSGVQVLGAEAEEVARLEVHTVPEAREEYANTLRRLLSKEKEAAGDQGTEDDMGIDQEEKPSAEPQYPGVCILLSWREPWKFLDQLRRWIQLLAKALLRPGTPATDPMDIIKDAELTLTVVVQHTEAQEELFREGYKEEDFDYISQCLRTAILRLHPRSALVYTSSSAPPQQPGSALSESQKVIYSSLGLDLAALSPKAPRSGEGTKREDFGPKHEFMDRMAIVIPAGWDSAAFIRTLSETFSPEDVLSSWLADLEPPPEPKVAPPAQTQGSEPDSAQVNGGAEVFETSPVEEEFPEPPMSPSKMPPSAIRTYEARVLDPQAHKSQRAPPVEVTTKPDQKFLAEMREHLQQLEAQDRDREASGRSTAGVSTTSSSGRVIGVPSGEQTGALNELGDVSFNVGGVSYDTVTAEAAIERLKRPPPQASSQSPLSPTIRTSTPKPPRPNRDLSGSEDRRSSGDRGTPSGSALSSMDPKKAAQELPIDKLEEYFQSLMSKTKGGSRDATPTRTKE